MIKNNKIRKSQNISLEDSNDSDKIYFKIECPNTYTQDATLDFSLVDTTSSDYSSLFSIKIDANTKSKIIVEEAVTYDDNDQIIIHTKYKAPSSSQSQGWYTRDQINNGAYLYINKKFDYKHSDTRPEDTSNILVLMRFSSTIDIDPEPEPEPEPEPKPEPEPDSSSGSTIILGMGNALPYAQAGGARMYLIETDDTKDATDSATVISTTNIDYPKTSQKASENIQYTNIDCSNHASFEFTVNISVTRPGVVSTCYLVPLLKPEVNDSTLPTSADGRSWNSIISDVQNTGDESYFAEIGYGYRDAQSLGFGTSCEIDLFEMTPIALATTLHGISKTNNKLTDTDGYWVNCASGSYATANDNWLDQMNDEGYNISRDDTETGTNASGNDVTHFIRLTYMENGTKIDINDQSNTYGPTDDFLINTTKNINIKNELYGYKSTECQDRLNEISSGKYIATDGWLYMTTTLTQGNNQIIAEVMSPGFDKNSGIDEMNLVVSEWVQTWAPSSRGSRSHKKTFI